MSDEEMRAAMAEKLQQFMAPNPEIEAMMGPRRRPIDPSFGDTIATMGDAYRQMPNGPTGPMAMGQTPVLDPYAPRMAQMPMPTRGFR